MKEIKWPYSEETKTIIEEIEKIEDIAALSKEERMKYDESIKVYRDNLAIASGQRKLGIEEGIGIGIEKGRKEGREEGIEEGVEKVARNLKSLGMAPELIKQATGLSIDEINNL